MILMVTYDLHNPGRDYDSVTELLKTARSCAHPQGSVWLLDTSASPSDWRDKLKAAGDSNDEYFVCRLRRNWASSRMDKDVVEWLNSPARTW